MSCRPAIPVTSGARNRYGYLVQVRDPGDAVEFGGLIKRDYRTGRREVWSPDAAVHAGEWLFVPTGTDEDAGYLLTYIYDDRTERIRIRRPRRHRRRARARRPDRAPPARAVRLPRHLGPGLTVR